VLGWGGKHALDTPSDEPSSLTKRLQSKAFFLPKKGYKTQKQETFSCMFAVLVFRLSETLTIENYLPK
jgi:hypothetical protein